MGEVVEHWHKYWKRYVASLALLVFLGLIIASIAYPPLIPLAAGLITYKGVAVLGFLTVMKPVVATLTLGLIGAVATSIGFTVLRAVTGLAEFFVLSIKNCIKPKSQSTQINDSEAVFDDTPQLDEHYDDEQEMTVIIEELSQRKAKHEQLSKSVENFISKYRQSSVKNEQLEALVKELEELVNEDILELDLSNWDEDYSDGVKLNKQICHANNELAFKVREGRQLLASFQSPSSPPCSTKKTLEFFNKENPKSSKQTTDGFGLCL